MLLSTLICKAQFNEHKGPLRMKFLTKIWNAIVAFLTSLNTHRVAYIGVAVGAVGAVTNPLATPKIAAALSHFMPPHDVSAIKDVLDAIGAVISLPAISTGLIGAYFGRPKTITSSTPAIPGKV